MFKKLKKKKREGRDSFSINHCGSYEKLTVLNVAWTVRNPVTSVLENGLPQRTTLPPRDSDKSHGCPLYGKARYRPSYPHSFLCKGLPKLLVLTDLSKQNACISDFGYTPGLWPTISLIEHTPLLRIGWPHTSSPHLFLSSLLMAFCKRKKALFA